jgi:hypothetical protein
LNFGIFREFRSLVIDMVLATDMSSHFQQIKTLKSLLGHSEFNIDKSKGLSYILHCSDISHPAKEFKLHYKWTKLLMEEFFRQVCFYIQKKLINNKLFCWAQIYYREIWRKSLVCLIHPFVTEILL